MAEEIGKAVVGELVSRGTSYLIDSYSHKCRTDIEEKLNRLNMLVLKLRSVSEVSDLYKVDSFIHVMRWKEKLNEVARQGDDMIQLFKERARLDKTENSQSAGYSIASSSKNAAKRLKRWFSGDDDLYKLNDTLKLLERTNAEVPDFLKLVKMHKRKRLNGIGHVQGVTYGYCQYPYVNPVTVRDPPTEASRILGLTLQIANWARAIPVAATCLYVWFCFKSCNSREERADRLITMIHYRTGNVREKVMLYPILDEWLAKIREVTSEGEFELHFLKSRENGLEDRSDQHTLCLGSLLSRLEKAAKDAGDIWEALRG